ncbi:MAG: PEGA domain-containing protein [Calditrichaeota bacterium]|nr:PEGA domain-containing protein [Calditrichota bacterium]
MTRIVILVVLFCLVSAAFSAEIDKIRVVVIQGNSDLPVNEVKSIISKVEEEIANADNFFTLLDRANLDALFGEVRISYEDWVKKYQSDSEVRLKMEGVTADHMLFVEIGRVSEGFYVSARMTKISTTETVAFAREQRETLAQLTEDGIKILVSKITKKLFESDVVFKAGVNNVQLSIHRFDGAGAGDKDITIDGQHRERLPYGKYRFVFYKKNYRSVKLESIINTPDAVINYEPERKQADIRLNGKPKSAEIVVDGEVLQQGFPFSQTFPEGKYQVVVRKQGFYEWNQRVQILDGQDFVKTTISLQRPPKMRAMIRSTILPGYGQYTLGYKSKGLILGSAYVGSITLAVLGQLNYEEEHANYIAFKQEYLALSSNEMEAYDAAKDAALKAHSREQLWNIVRYSGMIGGVSIWIWSEIETWMLSGTPGGMADNFNIDFNGNGVSVGYSF